MDPVGQANRSPCKVEYVQNALQYLLFLLRRANSLRAHSLVDDNGLFHPWKSEQLRSPQIFFRHASAIRAADSDLVPECRIQIPSLSCKPALDKSLRVLCERSEELTALTCFVNVACTRRYFVFGIYDFGGGRGGF